jgi:hypothetical protein
VHVAAADGFRADSEMHRPRMRRIERQRVAGRQRHRRLPRRRLRPRPVHHAEIALRAQCGQVAGAVEVGAIEIVAADE